LDVASALLDARLIQRRTDEHRNGFSFTFPQVARCDLAVGLLAFDGVTEHDVGAFMRE